MSANNQEKKKYRYGMKFSLICCCISVCVVVLLFFSCCFVCQYFVCHLQTNEVFDTSHGLKFDEQLIAQIDSLDGNGNYQDTVALKQEVRQLKRLIKYVIDRESNYQMEIDFIIDKYSQWTGYWLSVIGCVLTLFTLLQFFLNYRFNENNIEKIDKAVEYCKDKVKNLEEGNEKKAKDIAEKYDKLAHQMKWFIHQNKLSCISVCLSSFPDAFSLTPNEERQKFIRIFMRMLHEEYSDFTYSIEGWIKSLTDYKYNVDDTNLKKKIGYAYLVWCDISIAVNHAMYDFTKPEQNMAFDSLKSKLCIAITKYHNNKINRYNLIEQMHNILSEMNNLLGVL